MFGCLVVSLPVFGCTESALLVFLVFWAEPLPLPLPRPRPLSLSLMFFALLRVPLVAVSRPALLRFDFVPMLGSAWL